jgi:hypothetical protein
MQAVRLDDCCHIANVPKFALPVSLLRRRYASLSFLSASPNSTAYIPVVGVGTRVHSVGVQRTILSLSSGKVLDISQGPPRSIGEMLYKDWSKMPFHSGTIKMLACREQVQYEQLLWYFACPENLTGVKAFPLIAIYGKRRIVPPYPSPEL